MFRIHGEAWKERIEEIHCLIFRAEAFAWFQYPAPLTLIAKIQDQTIGHQLIEGVCIDESSFFLPRNLSRGKFDGYVPTYKLVHG